MTKNANGLWSVTLGPLESDLYEYQFLLDGRKITDPGNDMPKPQRQVDTSLLLIPGIPPVFLTAQNVWLETSRNEPSYSPALGKNEQALSTPPPTSNLSHFLFLLFSFYN